MRRRAARLTRPSRLQVTFAFAAAAAIAWAGAAHAAELAADFYKGKTIRLLIGYSVGGGYDQYARILARHMGKYIPGNPSIVPENMPGAGSLKVVNYIYNIAPKDGTVFATFGRGLAMEPLLKHSKGIRFKAEKLTWLGSITDETSICAMWHTTGIKTWQDLETSKTVLKVGGTGAGSDTDIYPTMLINLFHVPLKLITGFPGGSEVNLALQRGEVQGRCGWSWSSLMSREKSLLDKHEINVIVQFGLKKHKDLPNVPLVTELTKDPKKLKALRLVVSRQSMARPYAAPPGIPADRVKALRTAFNKTMEDKDFLAETGTHHLEVNPTDGQEVEDLVKEIYDAPDDVKEMAIAAMGTPAKKK